MNNKCIVQGIILNTGPLVLTEVYYKYSNTFNGLVDILFPPQILHLDESSDGFKENKDNLNINIDIDGKK